jgi:hypothetical protein
MDSVSLGPISIEPDPEQTRGAYILLGAGEPRECGCSHCQEFLAAVEKSLSQEALEFLHHSGVDIFKPVGLGHYGWKRGIPVYGGEYVLVCSGFPMVDYFKARDGFQYSVTHPSPSVPVALAGFAGLVCFTFMGPCSAAAGVQT